MPSRFEFVRYEIAQQRDRVVFFFHDGLREYQETIQLPDPIPQETDETLLGVFLFNLHLALGISYWKAQMLPIAVSSGIMTDASAAYWNTVYTDGLGEFYFRNALSFPSEPLFTPGTGADTHILTVPALKKRSLIGIGGGKDSLVAWKRMEKNGTDNRGLIIGTGANRSRIESIAQACGIPYLAVRRLMDPQFLVDQKKHNWYQGHVPISMIYAWIGLLCSFLYDYEGFVVSNEQSADAGNVEYEGRTVNHQWSKSTTFERLMDRYLTTLFTSPPTYYSPLRALSELAIVEEVVQYDDCLNVITSCNRNFVQESPTTSRWCGACAKCAFNYLLYASVLPPERLVGMFEKNLFSDTSLVPLFETVLGRRGIKPFDCVGTFEEAQLALSRVSLKSEYSSLPVVVQLTTT